MRVLLDGGEVIDLGAIETSPTIGITDFSRRETDEFGVTTVVERTFRRRYSARLLLPSGSVDEVQRRLAELRATPAQWVASETIASLSVRGFYKDFTLDLPTATISYCTLTIEGLDEPAPIADPGTDPAPDARVSSLQLLQPQTVAEAVLTSSSVLETEYPVWGAGTTYGKGARVVRAHRVWESVDAGNIGNDPAAAPEKWLDLAPTNRWAMFDQALGTVTTGTSEIVVVLTPAEAVDGLALLDTDAGVIRVQAPGYDRTLLRGGGYPEPAAMVLTDLVVAAGASITVTLGAAGGATTPRTWNDAATWTDAGRWQDADVSAGPGPVSVGTLLLGRMAGLGVTEASPTASLIDYSRKDVDEFGDAMIVERAWAKRMDVRAVIRTDAIDIVAGRIAAVRARPSLWIGQNGFDSLTVYGFFKDFSIEAGTSVSKLSLSIEGLSKAAPIIDPAADLKKLRADLEKTEADLAALASDNLLSHGQEKATLVRDYAILSNTLQSLDARYQALNSPADVTTARNVAFARRGDLDALLLSYTPQLWNDLTTDTTIDGQILRATWTQAADAISTFAAAITGRPGEQGPPGEDGITNLLDTTEWIPGQPLPPRFARVENPAGETTVVLLDGPSGASEPVVHTFSVDDVPTDAPGAPDGGFTYTFTADEFDPQVSYRFMVWMRQSGPRTADAMYFGTGNAANGVKRIDGSFATNPYFWTGNLPADNQWYLVVGIMHGASYTGADTSMSGVYDPATGQRVIGGADFKFDPAATSLSFRAFQYYRATGGTADIARPSVEPISQTTYSIDQLFATVGMTAQQAQAFTLAQQRIAAISSDDIIAAYAEKQTLIGEHDRVTDLATKGRAESLSLNAIYGGDPTAAQRASLDSAMAALDTYLGGLVPGWADITVDTPVIGTQLRNLFTAAYSAAQTMIAANSAFIRNRAKATQDRVTAVASDAVITAGSEKQTIILDYTALYNDFMAIDARYVALGSPSDITPARTSAYGARVTLDNLLLSYNPSWSDITVDTPIPDPADFRAKWANAEKLIGEFATAVTGRKGDKGDKGDPGLSAYAFLLSNENQILPADAAGNIVSYSGAATGFTVFANGQDATASFTPSIIENPQALTTNLAATSVVVTGGLDANEPSAYLKIRMTGNGAYAGVQLDRQFSLTKSRVGADGLTARDVKISASTMLVRLDTNGNVVANTINIKAVKQNSSVVLHWRMLDLDGTPRTSWDTATSIGPGLGGSYVGPDEIAISATQLLAHMSYSGTPGQIFQVAFSDDYSISDRVSIIRVRDGVPGANAPLVKTQWSIDGVSNWHDNYFGADVYARQSNDGGATYGPAYRAIGESGQVGTDGTSPSNVFKRSANTPPTPGDNTGNPPPGWSDGPPAGTDFIWQSTARFRGAVQLTSWSTPQRISGADGAPGLSFDINLSAAEVAATIDGTVKQGQLPIEIAVKVLSGGNDVTNAAAITVAPASGISASYSAKIVSITAVGASGEVVISATYGGTPVGSKRVAINKRLDSASSSSTSSAGPLSVAIPSNGGSSSYADAIGAPVLTLTPNAAGVIQCDAKMTYASPSQKIGNQPIRAGDFTPAARFQYRENGTSTWLPVGGEVPGSQAVYYTNDNDPDQNDVHGGELTISQQATGLDPVKQYDLRLQPRRVSSTPPSATTNVAGNQAFSRP